MSARTCVRTERGYVSICTCHGDVFLLTGEGYLVNAWMDGTLYRLGVSGEMISKRRCHPGRAIIRRLHTDEKREVIERACARLRDVREDVLACSPGVERVLDAVGSIDALEERERVFRRTYGSVGILPPDRYLSVVVQVTEGCAHNRCTFCTFYKGQRFRVRSDMEGHISDVLMLFGGSIHMRRGVFLGEASALSAPVEHLMEAVRLVRERMPAGVTGYGIYAFASAGDVLAYGERSLFGLAGSGMRRIYVGLESGYAPLLGMLNKPDGPEDCVEAVRMLKRTGMNVGVIVLGGVGTEEEHALHVSSTLDTLESMHLTRGDIVYISPLVLDPGSSYAQKVEPVHPDAWGEAVRMKTQLQQRYAPGGPTVSTYSIEEFIY